MSRAIRADRSAGARSASGLSPVVLVWGILLWILGWAVAPPPASSAPEVDLHDLTWRVHVDLIRPEVGEDLAYWQGVIDAAVASANQLIEGGQGPFDSPCCARLVHSANVTTFGSPGDGLDVLDDQNEQIALNNLGRNGSYAYLIDSINYCGGSAPGSLGCGELPACSGNGGDDPNLWMAVTLDSFDDGTLAAVVAHERGHNACLQHVAAAECQVMQANVLTPGLGGCMASLECSKFQAGRTQTSSGASCGCLDDLGGILGDGTPCADVVGGVCSGGVCGEMSGSAGVRLMAAGNPGSANGGPPDDAIEISALKGDWRELGRFGAAGPEIEGLAFATDSGVLYGVVPGSGDDAIVTLDPATGEIQAIVGSIANGGQEMISMAYDPGPTSAPSDDRLILLEVSGPTGELRWIDPASPSQANLYGSILWTPASAFQGLAYDSVNRLLYASTPFSPDGLYRIDLSSCPPSPCDAEQVPGAGLYRDNSSLGYSPKTGLLYLVGTAFSGQRTFYNVIDPSTGVSLETLSLDVFTPSGLAAVPEPDVGTGLWLGAVLLAGLSRVSKGWAKIDSRR